MKNIIISMLSFACIGMMYGKLFNKPEKYYYIQEKGYLNEKEYKALQRTFLAKDLADSFNEQLNLWYNKANEDIFSENIKKDIYNEINENVKDRKNINDFNTYPVDLINRSTGNIRNIWLAEPVVKS